MGGDTRVLVAVGVVRQALKIGRDTTGASRLLDLQMRDVENKQEGKEDK